MHKNVRQFVALLAAFLPVCAAASTAPALQVIPSLDLPRYAGKWFEIARLPNFFERQCVADTTATYTLRPDGAITVLNECRRSDGGVERAKGIARLRSSNDPNSKLRVSFFRPFYGEYWVIALNPEYRWALVGEPQRRYLWVLSRTADMDAATLAGILDQARSQGYDVSRVMVARRP